MNKKLLTFAACVVSSALVFAYSDAILSQIDSQMTELPGGTFLMGSEDYEGNEKPVHEETVGAFLISLYEVKQNEYRNIMGINYSANRDDENPVEEVSFYDALVFCNKLSIAKGLEPCYSINGETDPDVWGEVPRITDEDLEEKKAVWDKVECNFEAEGYRLPTEAEWEYAASYGSDGDGSLYAGNSDYEQVAWGLSNGEDSSHGVGLKEPNGAGLYDMCGNVWEWCWTEYAGRYDVEGYETGKRIRRGGSFKSAPEFLRTTNRASSVPELRGVDLGFRVVRSVKTEAIDLFSVIEETVSEVPER